MSSFNESLERAEQAGHHRGRSEFCMETIRIVYDQVMDINESITARTQELNTDESFTGYIADDVRLIKLRAMREALDAAHKKSIAL